MSKTDLNIPSLENKFIDIRESLPGDSFKWNWERDLSYVNFLAIHHTATPNTQTPEEIANFHIQTNGWGGIGYHFLIAFNGVVYYCGDISTARANVANLNDQVIGVGLIGNFTADSLPSDEQIDSARKLCEFFIKDYPNLSNIDSWKTVRAHSELPNQSTICPGDNWALWKGKLILENALNHVETGYLQQELESQVDNLQTSQAFLNQQVISLQEKIAEKDREINLLREKDEEVQESEDTTLTILQVIFALARIILAPGREKLNAA